ncbi:MAG: carboxypeptidase regulatory-like domain-containing protein [Xanthomonadales bacterium]|nr:carboxypeptidase regulatory-like domain-containing protein [Xanthomonadales bacterium]
MRGSFAIVAAMILALCACAPLQQRSGSGAPDSDTRETTEGEAGTVPEPATREESERPRPPEPNEPEPLEPTADQEDSAAQPTEPDAASDASDAPEAAARPAAPAAADPEPEEGATSPPEPAGRESAQEAPSTPQQHDLDGRIRLVGGDADVDEAIVYFIAQSTGSAAASASASGPTEIVTRDKQLSPTVLAVPRGTEVRFPNDDPILHNLFSVSSNNEFDLGVYGPGESPSVRFEHPGAVNIYCNVHHNMHAHVLVVDTPWHTRADADGRFSLSGLPAGDGELRVWHRQSEAWSRSIELPVDEPVEVSLEVTKPRLPPHRDKTGQPYNRRDRDPYR